MVVCQGSITDSLTNRGTYPDGKLPGQPIQTHLLLAKNYFPILFKSIGVSVNG